MSKRICKTRLIKRLATHVVLVLFLFALSSTNSLALSSDEQIHIGILPCADVVKTFEQFQPLVRYIQNSIDQPVSLIVSKNMQELHSLLMQGKIQFAFLGPDSYVELSSSFNQQHLLKILTPEGSDTSSALIITRKDSGIATLKDLKGRSMEFGLVTSTFKWLAARILLQQAEINIKKDLSYYSHGGCCTDIIMDVYFNKFDAGVICQDGLEEVTDNNIDISEIRILAETPPIHNTVFTASKTVSAGLVQRVNNALLELDVQNEEHKNILLPIHFGSFKHTTDEHYNKLRKLIREIGEIE